MIRKLSIVTLLLLCLTRSNAQDPNFTHFFNNTLYYNPAVAGINNGLRLTMDYRSLWSPLPSRFNTVNFSVDAAAIYNTGMGMMLFTDVEGEGKLRTTSMKTYYSYRPIETRNLEVQVGFEASVVHKTVDFSQFVFSDQLDEVFGNVNGSAFIPPNVNQVVYPDFGTGFVVRFNNPGHMSQDLKLVTTLGAGFHHLTAPQDAFLNTGTVPFKWVVHGGTNIHYKNLIYAPAFLYEKQAQFSTFQIGMNMLKSPVHAGFWFRNRTAAFNGAQFDSFIFNIGSNFEFQNGNKMKVCYSYDFTISRLRPSSLGTHEISIVYEIGNYTLFSGILKRQRFRYKTRFLKCVDGF